MTPKTPPTHAGDDLARMKSAIDNSITPVMQIDRDFRVTYVNRATRALFQRHAAVFQRLFPGANFDAIEGTCIDVFHKRPEHQRDLLADPANLPYTTDIRVGDLVFQLQVTAIVDANGAYVGNNLEWNDVTQARRAELENTRLRTAVDGANTNIMMCDLDLNITYANRATVKTLRRYEAQLKRLYPHLDVSNLVGTNIDGFHKDPGRVRNLLRDPSNLPHRATIKVGPLFFDLTVTAVLDAKGNYIGICNEWSDVTEQMDAEQQIEGLIENAVAGRLDERIDATRYEGFMRTLSEGINKLLDSVVAPSRATAAVMKALSEGDLRERMTGDFQGEFSALQNAVNASMENLASMVDEIFGAASSIKSAAGEIAVGNVELSQRTEEQASSLEETSSSLEELTSTVKQNAASAEQANQLASGAREQAEKGGVVVGRAVEAMSAINQASKKIADIIGVIDEIAFQTNLLALNAAVEAARAGEQGRGFAVVAAEVRNLAQRSAQAAKEIKALISDSVDKVEDGSRLVDQSGHTLQEIVHSVKKVSDIIAEIAAASREQSQGIEEVSKAVSQLDEITQQNAAMVEEAAAAAGALDDQAKGMSSLVSFFTTHRTSAAPESATASVSRPAPAAARPAAPRAASPAKPQPVAAPAASGPIGGDDWAEF